ncbi:MAG: DUF1858 domain-containing protein [Candidatus Margulisbacteria bacterium]|nr:DUF1858 domain-containing protein [Candidatus Margulisiibacteriota bacterium]MBU1617717.1 DUF1858 domain-containing protein [Candidatus Margulisiibacteriota bacterium]
MEETISAETTIADALKKKPHIAAVLMGKGMHCIGCVIASGETIAQAAEVHGLDVNELLNEINQA